MWIISLKMISSADSFKKISLSIIWGKKNKKKIYKINHYTWYEPWLLIHSMRNTKHKTVQFLLQSYIFVAMKNIPIKIWCIVHAMMRRTRECGEVVRQITGIILIHIVFILIQGTLRANLTKQGVFVHNLWLIISNFWLW